MTASMPEDTWTPYKYLYNVVETSLAKPSKESLSVLESVLGKHNQNFINILRNPPKNSTSRAQIKKGMIDGIDIPGTGHTILSKDLVDECLILSDMYDLEEYIALELLCTAQQQMHHHPGLPRGLVAVLLYYDGRKALVCALRDLFQARSGVSWCTEAPVEVINFLTSYTDNLIHNSNMLNRIVELLEQLDISKEMGMLAANRALGPPKHHRQIIDLFEDVRLALAMILFNCSAQCGLPKLTALKLIEYLKNYKPTEMRGEMDNIVITILMALLYSFDISVLQRHEDGERIVQDLPIIKDSKYSSEIYDALKDDRNWEWDDKIKSIVIFAFGLAMSSLRQAPQNLQQNSLSIIEKDEQLIDNAIQYRVFDFIYYYLLENEIIFKTEFFYRRIHVIFTDFIENMHSKVTELRGRAEETAKTVQSYTQEGIDPPLTLDHSFELLMLAIGKFYAGDRLKLYLSLEYWGPMDIPTNYLKSSNRSVSLFKFIRSAGEVLPPILFVPYLKMLAGLSNCEQSARNTFNLLKQGSNSSGSTALSWDHFFGSLARYYANLRQEHQPRSDTVYRNRVLNRSIKPIEIEGLHAVFELVRIVAQHDEVACVAICEHPNWSPLHILLGLLSCSVPITLKADILLTLATLAKSKDNAIQLWNNLEASQIICTLPTTSSYTKIGLEAEIEQVESRNETYPLSKAALEFLYKLSQTIMPKNLGGGTRKPGLDPYITFIIDRIFMKFYSRNYKNIAEKWEVGEKCLKLISFYLKIYDVSPADFAENKEENPPPGFHIMLQMHSPSEMLRLIFLLIDEARSNLDTYTKFAGKKELEKCSLYALSILERALNCQELFLEAHSIARSSIALSGLKVLMLNVNTRSGMTDNLLNTTKFVTYNSWLPGHALIAVKILTIVCQQPNVNAQIMSVFTKNETFRNEIRHGFVECLESDFPPELEDISDDTALNEVGVNIKEAVLNLLQECLPQQPPNISHYLLGLDTGKDIGSIQLQKLDILNYSNTCSKSLITLLDNNLELFKSMVKSDPSQERIIDKAYQLLYSLCFNFRTSEVTLRMLRSHNDFLCRHILALPFKNYESALVLSQMSNLLKCAAIELKMTAENNQISQFSHLTNVLSCMMQDESADVTTNIELRFQFHETYVNSKTGQIPLICNLLNCVDFETKPLDYPKWNYFDSSLTKQILQDCEVKTESGQNLINIKKLHDILYDELNIVQNTIAAGQRQLILQEIESVLVFALKINEQKKKYYFTIKFMEAWGQVTEILFCVAPVAAMDYERKEELIITTLQCLLKKIIRTELILEVANVSSATVLLLFVNLRCCYDLKIRHFSQQDNTMQASTSSAIASSMLCLTKQQPHRVSRSSTAALKYVLKGIIDWIISSSIASQNLRINLYASLLNFIQIIKTDSNMIDSTDEDEQYVSRLDRSSVLEKDKKSSVLVFMAEEVFAPYSDSIIEILCNDCVSGHDICKMLALSCIENLLDFSFSTNFILFIAKRGYLSHLIDSLLKSDENLCRVLSSTPDSNSMRSLYIYESRMAMLNKVATSQIGAELILEQKILGALSNMKVFDLHPDFQMNKLVQKVNLNLQVPPVDNRYQQILFPALSLCDVIISTLGTENYPAISHILNFILSHGEMVEIVLRAGTPSLDLGLLQELAGITGIISRITSQELTTFLSVNSSQAVDAQIYRLQRSMISLFPRFIISDTTFKMMFKPESVTLKTTTKNKTEYMKHFLEIAANTVLYCRNAIANHTAGHRTTGIIFAPTIIDSVPSQLQSSRIEITPSLGIVIIQLKNCVEFYNKEKREFDNISHQKSLLIHNNLDYEIQSQLLDLNRCLTDKRNELTYYSFIIEHCLYIIWAHLDFYMKRAIPVNTLQFSNQSLCQENDTFISSPTEAGWKISSDDVSKLKKSLVLVFNEIFCKQLISTASSEATVDKGFIEALLRRIKCLIQFVPVD